MTKVGDILPPIEYNTFEEFYPFYLSQHSNLTCRRLHVIGSTLAILQLIRCLLVGFTLIQFLLIFVIGYGFAWVGHYVFEKNKPATFKYPLFSLQGDVRLLYETYTGQRKFWWVTANIQAWKMIRNYNFMLNHHFPWVKFLYFLKKNLSDNEGSITIDLFLFALFM